MSGLYDTDFRAWMQTQVAALRAGDLAALDLENLIDEMESIERQDSHRLWHALRELLVWFLCWGYAPQMRDLHPHWYVRIGSCRVDLDVLTHVWPHLRDKAEKDLPKCWTYAREVASEETGLPIEMFPETCPWTAKLIMHTTFWPMGCDDLRPVWPADDDLVP